MRTAHTIVATYPLAGSEDGLPVDIRFTYEPFPKLEPDIDFHSVIPHSADWLPQVILDAIAAWAREWLDDDDGYARAWDVAADDTERQREQARDMAMVRS